MGYRLKRKCCSTFRKRSTATGATGAISASFAPVLQLLQPPIGERELEQVERARASRAQHRTPAATRPAGAYGWPTMTLAYSPPERLDHDR
jgi:hypothetical protein